MVAGAALAPGVVASAPTGAGVYFFLGPSRELLYIGKATNVRSRLQQHARGGGRLTGLYARAEVVRWEEHPSELEAVAREADLLAARPPPYNAAGSTGGWSDVVVGGRRYGCFPHLGRGLATVPGTACTDGFVALLRLLWAATIPDRPEPSKLTTDRLPDLPEPLRRPVHDLFVGTSDRVLDLLADRVAETCEPYRQPGLRRDRVSADGFFLHGPSRLRALRRRHGLGSGHVPRARVVGALADELRALLGDDLVLPTPPDPSLLGPRASRSLRHTKR